MMEASPGERRRRHRIEFAERNMRLLVIGLLLVTCPAPALSQSSDFGILVKDLKSGGYVIVFRHGATDESQRDVYPFKFDDMSAQRQLSEKGRETARQIGEAFTALGIPVGVVYSSRLNRAVETARLIGRKDVTLADTLTDSGAGNPSSMANPTGKNAQAGKSLRAITDAPPDQSSNNLVVTHKTNITDAFGKDFSDIGEGEAIVLHLKPGSSSSTFVRRVLAKDWITAQQ
jgi:phosphohistidine phosphatase SixA